MRRGLVLGLGLGALALILLTGCMREPEARHSISIEYSRFSDEQITVRAGVPVTFELRNDDPILHEWIVGDEDVHERHRNGTEKEHDDVPTEITLPAFESRETTITFNRSGEYAFICHLPGHEAYGMTGVVRVVDS